MGPICKHDEVDLPVGVGDVCDFDGDEVFGEGSGVGAFAVPPKDIVVESLLEVDGTNAALVDEGGIIIDFLRQVKSSNAAIYLL